MKYRISKDDEGRGEAWAKIRGGFAVANGSVAG
jgi:hypothetical protein